MTRIRNLLFLNLTRAEMFNMQDLLYMHAREKRLHTPSIETPGVFILNDPAPLLFRVSLSSTLAQSWEYNKHVNAWREDG